MVIEVGQKQNREERNYLLLAARINNYSKKKKGKTKTQINQIIMRNLFHMIYNHHGWIYVCMDSWGS